MPFSKILDDGKPCGWPSQQDHAVKWIRSLAVFEVTDQPNAGEQ